MNTYRIEKVRSPVTVVLSGGDRVEGDIFLSHASRFRPEPQEPVEFLNEQEGYFALGRPDGRALLIAKDNVEAVEVAAGDEPPRQTPPHEVRVEVGLVSGTVISGSIHLDTPPSRARLLDFLNSHLERFICVVQPGGIVLINRHAIGHVHELT